MRLVSQDGTCDIPYNLCSVYMLKAYDCYKVLASNTDIYTLATYSTEQKALKAMEMLREEYQKYYSNNGGGMMATAEFYVQPFAFNHPKVFQFPKDEEIEV